MTQSLVSSRTAKEYNVLSNGASEWEGLRSPEVSPGKLPSEDILKRLGTGLLLSNLHYLNWSDVPAGRITGMTRYACFYVENGVIKAPIKDLRFDESLYEFFGNGLEAVTDFQELIPNTSTYERRGLGGNKVPGLLIRDFNFTL